MMEDRQRREEENERARSLRAEAEKRLARTFGAKHEREGKTHEEIVYELEVHQIELEMQNEALRKARFDLEESRDRYADLYDFAPVGYFTFTCRGVIEEVNLTGAALLRIERKKLLNRGFGRFVAEEDLAKWDRHLLDVQQNPEKQNCELLIKRENGPSFYAGLESVRVDLLSSGTSVVRTIVSDITDRKQAAQQIKQALREKETLLREIHHRVRNNMAVVSGLLSLQATKIKDETARSLFEESQQRVESMAIVHELLYQTKDLASVNFEDYISSIVSEIISLYRIDTHAITTEINIEDIGLDLESAVPCGLIINELLTNAFKYAFPDNRKGVLSVDFTKTDDTYTLVVKDNGVGLPEGFDYKGASTLGLQLVNVLTAQLSGTLQIKSDKGTEAAITFKTKRE